MRLSRRLLIYPVIAGISMFLTNCSNEWKNQKNAFCEKLEIGYCGDWGEDYELFVKDLGRYFSQSDSLDKSLLKEAENFVSGFEHNNEQFRKDLGDFYYDEVRKSLSNKSFVSVPRLTNLAREFYKGNHPGKLEKEMEVVDSLYSHFNSGSDYGAPHYLANFGLKFSKDNEFTKYIKLFEEGIEEKGITKECKLFYESDIGKIK